MSTSPWIRNYFSETGRIVLFLYAIISYGAKPVETNGNPTKQWVQYHRSSRHPTRPLALATRSVALSFA
jgi:hypothetical protein